MRAAVGRLVVSTAIALGALVPLAVPAAATAGGCTVASATAVTLGAPNLARGDCNTPRYLLAASAGDVITFDVDSTTYTGFNETGVFLQRPGTTDATWGSPYRGVGCQDTSPAVYWQLVCTLPLTGTYVVNVDANLTFTPRLAAGTRNPRTVAGECTIAAAPSILTRVPQYAQSSLCDAGTGYTNWKLSLVRGDRVSFAFTAFGDDDGSLEVYPPGTTDFNVTGSVSAVCRMDTPFRGSSTGLCGPVAKTGVYVARTYYGSFRFTPTVVHAVTVSVAAKAKVKKGKKFTVTATLRSPAGTPVGRCTLQYRSGSRWKALSTVTATAGVCVLPGRFRTKGTRGLRVVEKGATGWASVTTKARTIRVV